MMGDTEYSILVLSDSHGDLDSLKTVLRRFGDKAGLILHAGDGAQDMERLRAQGVGVKPWEAVRGNMDHDSRFLPQRIVEYGGKRIFLSHGHSLGVGEGLDNLIRCAQANEADMALFGHTHRPYWEDVSGLLVLNPGSLSRPRGRDHGSFALVTWADGQCFLPRFYELAGPGRKTIREIKAL